MDDAETAARIAELEMELAAHGLECRRLEDLIHEKRNRMQVITLRIAELRRRIAPD